MSLAWPVNENGRSHSRAASHVTVVQPWAKWAWRWATSPQRSTRSATATACSSSLRYTLRGRQPWRARTACAAAIAADAEQAQRVAPGRRGAAPAAYGRRLARSQGTARVADSDVIAGQVPRPGPHLVDDGVALRSSGGVSTTSRIGTPSRSSRQISLVMNSSLRRG